MRLVSYNILDGGLERGEKIFRVISSRRPDIVALLEADDADLVDDLAGKLQMDKIWARGNAAHAAAILSRWPIRTSVNHAALRPAMTNCCLEAVIDDPRGFPWIVAAIHLHARAFEKDEQIREIEIAQVLEAMAVYRDGNARHLLCGDFNSNSPIQEIDPARCKPRTREAWQQNGGKIPRRVIQRILDAGYVDTLHRFHGPAAGRMTTFTTDHPGQRLDYVFTHGFTTPNLRDAWIDPAPPAAEASDHYPVGVELEVAPQ